MFLLKIIYAAFFLVLLSFCYCEKPCTPIKKFEVLEISSIGGAAIDPSISGQLNEPNKSYYLYIWQNKKIAVDSIFLKIDTVFYTIATAVPIDTYRDSPIITLRSKQSKNLSDTLVIYELQKLDNGFSKANHLFANPTSLKQAMLYYKLCKSWKTLSTDFIHKKQNELP